MISPGKYTRDQIASMGLNFDEVTSAQTVGGKSYKLDNPGDGSRVVSEVQLQGGGQGSGGFVRPGATPTVPSTPSAPITGFNQPTIDLPTIYKNLQETSGIAGLEKELSDKTVKYNDALSKINDNPFLAESNRMGRGAKLSGDFERSTANLRNDIATKKADIETQLSLQTKQFDINSQQAQQALQQFNTLLSAGALDGASGEDIANITRATGLSSSMIQSAINVSKESKKKDIPTQTISFDDGTNTGFAVINSQTGEIISKQTVAASKPTKATGGSTKEDNKKKQMDEAQYLVNLYQNTNKKNPSWQKAHDLRNTYSPNDFYYNLLQTYPEAKSYIQSIKSLFIKK